MTQARPFPWTRAGSAGAANTGAPARLRAAAETAAAALPALMLSAPVRKTGLSVRLGHKPTERETFVGFSFSTY